MDIDHAGAEVDMLGPAMRELALGVSLPEFCARFADGFAQQLMPGATARTSTPEQAADEARRAAMAFARELWRLTPDPEHGWRARILPEPGRNDPCWCGSGRKYKQCCQPLAADLRPLHVDPAHMAALLFLQGPAHWRTPEALRRMPHSMLAVAVQGWHETHGDEALMALLEPVFASPAGLGDAFEEAFDVLQDAMQNAGQDARREKLARAVAEGAAGRSLRCTARSRVAVLAMDRGDPETAWQQFKLAQREQADHPQLLHLELMLLLAQGRLDEAKVRAPLLAARARRQDLPELADALLRLGKEGFAGLAGGEGTWDEEESAWVAVLREPLAQLDAATFARANAIECQGEGGEAELIIAPGPEMRRRLKGWSSRFAAVPPMLTSLRGEAGAILDEPDAAREWLARHPECVATVTVLDDLLLAAQQMLDESSMAPRLAAAAGELAFGAANAIVAALDSWPQARLSWPIVDNRPVLRVMAQAIDLALQLDEVERAVAWMRWMVARNPTDNHGWREVLRVELLTAGDAAGALELLDAYPGDAPPADHDRVLALYQLGRRNEAEALLREAHAAFPAFALALLPEALDRPMAAGPGFHGLGDEAHAWEWCLRVGQAWAGSGALEWLRNLQLPPAAAQRKPAKRGSRSKGPAAPRAQAKAKVPAFLQRDLNVLRQHFGPRLPWLLGWLAGVAWAPGGLVASTWIGQALEHAPRPLRSDNLDPLLQALMALYNHLNGQRLKGKVGRVPLPDAIEPDDDAGWKAFAAGFVQMAEAHTRARWRAAGLGVQSKSGPFAPLYQLAAHAEPGPGGWRATSDEGQPLLALVEEQPSARAMLDAAMQPLWRAVVTEVR